MVMEGEGATSAPMDSDSETQGAYEDSQQGVSGTIGVPIEYNGSQDCTLCGMMMNPVQAIYAYQGLCPDCRRRRIGGRKQNRMVDDGSY